MSWVDGMRARVGFLVGRSRAERELEEELAFHLERETERNVARGMDPADAARAARRSIGVGERFREEVRDEWFGALAGMGQDVRHGVRRLRRRPGFAAVALLTLGLGIGATTAIFSLVRGILLEPLPYGDPDRLVMFWNAAGDQRQDTWLSARELVEYRQTTVSFDALAGYTHRTANLVQGEPERVRAAAVTANTFAVLGTPALHGRTFTADEDTPGADDVVLLGHEVWQRHFGGAADVVGQEIRVNGVARTVVGVMPPDFRLPLDYREDRPTELWVPAAIDPSQNLPWGSRSYYIVGRLAPGVTAERATADLARTHAEWARAGVLGDGAGELDRVAVPVTTLVLGGVRPALWILFGAAGVLLLIACANVTHLLLARSHARRREIAAQLALGAGRARIARQLLVESGLLAVLGAALGIVIAYAGLRTALALTPINLIRMKGVELDLQVLAFAALLALATTLVAGLAPALRLSGVNVAGAMAAGRGDVGSMRRGARRLLVVSEIALSLVLVLGAALLTRSFTEMRRIDLGFDPGEVLTLRLELPAADYPDQERAGRFYRELVERVSTLPRVEAAGAVRVLPLSSTIGDWSLTIEHRPAVPGENLPADWQIVTAGYFEALRLERASGRFLTVDDDETGRMVAVINESMAARYWPGQDALGKRFHLGTLDQPWIEVVGVVRDVRRNAVVEDPRAEMYLPHAQFVRAKDGGAPQRAMTLVVRSDGDPLTLLPLVREQVRALDPGLPVSDIRTLDAVTAAALAQPRFTTLLLGAFAALALALAATGLYGVISFVTARRTHEIGVRMALGAERRAVTRLIMRDGLAMATTGVAIGLLASVGLTRLLAGQLYAVAPLDPWAFAAAPAILLATAAIASYLPARRAAGVDPVTALRED